MTAVTQDPFETASNAEPLRSSYYAQVQCDAWYCVLVKGTGKVVFDPNQHPIEQRRTALSISLATIPEQPVQFPLVREMIAESAEWTKHVWPSAKVLGLSSARDLNGKWAKVELAPTGDTYKNKQGDTKERTTFKFLAFYADEAACRAAYGAGGNAQATAAPATAPASPVNGADTSKERETALQFLKVLMPKWLNGTMDLDKVKAGIAANPVIARHFDANSPEVIQLMVDNSI
jgi:hypothetical protein